MRRAAACLLALLLVAGATGCFRTHYTGLYGRNGDAPVGFTGQAQHHPASWQHFFLFGWIPGERHIDSGEICGDRGIQEIETRQSFLQGLVTSLASFYINIYAPWTGRTECR